MDSFLYDRDIRHERVKTECKHFATIFIVGSQVIYKFKRKREVSKAWLGMVCHRTRTRPHAMFNLGVWLSHVLFSMASLLRVRLSYVWQSLRGKSYVQKFICIFLVSKKFRGMKRVDKEILWDRWYF